METCEIDWEEIARFQKQGMRYAEEVGEGKLMEEERPMLGFVQKKKTRFEKAKDVLNIGSGTRCKECGLLHFCWVDNCSVCGNPMEFNLGHRDDEARW